MSFFGIFGGGKDDDKNCDCNKVLKDHLKKCAGYGQRPPVVEGCSSGKDACDDLSGPPTCKGKTEAPKCCPVTKFNKPKLFVPKCTVPPTATFKCPASSCDAVCDDTSAKPVIKKPDCVPIKGQSKPPVADAPKSKNNGSCGGTGSNGSGSGSGSGKNGSGSGSDNDCEPRPLQM